MRFLHARFMRCWGGRKPPARRLLLKLIPKEDAPRMTLRQQIVKDRVDQLAATLNVDHDIAFLRFAHTLVTSQSVYSFDETELVDGGQDKQIDLISIYEEEDGSADIYILQGKNTHSFSSNSLIGMKNGLHWLFQTPREELEMLGNTALRDKISEFRAVQSTHGPSNIRLFVRFIANGHTAGLSDEYQQEATKLVSEYDNETYDRFDFQTIGSDELVELLNRSERQSRRVDGTVEIRYDTNNPSLIKYHAQGLKRLGVFRTRQRDCTPRQRQRGCVGIRPQHTAVLGDQRGRQ